MVQGVRVGNILQSQPPAPRHDATELFVDIAIRPLIYEAQLIHEHVNGKFLPVDHVDAPIRKIIRSVPESQTSDKIEIQARNFVL
jgi:hypothetical protein